MSRRDTNLLRCAARAIVLDESGCLIDGRNRLEACDRAGIEPTFTVHTGDPVAFIVSANLQRRDLPKSVKAYYAVASDLDSKSEGKDLAAVAGCSAAYIAQARIVARERGVECY